MNPLDTRVQTKLKQGVRLSIYRLYGAGGKEHGELDGGVRCSLSDPDGSVHPEVDALSALEAATSMPGVRETSRLDTGLGVLTTYEWFDDDNPNPSPTRTMTSPVVVIDRDDVDPPDQAGPNQASPEKAEGGTITLSLGDTLTIAEVADICGLSRTAPRFWSIKTDTKKGRGAAFTVNKDLVRKIREYADVYLSVLKPLAPKPEPDVEPEADLDTEPSESPAERRARDTEPGTEEGPDKVWVMRPEPGETAAEVADQNADPNGDGPPSSIDAAIEALAFAASVHFGNLVRGIPAGDGLRDALDQAQDLRSALLHEASRIERAVEALTREAS